MPYPPEHKAETRSRIVASARRLFNRRGFAEVTIDEIMSDAGLTRGGFYNHFATKDELYAEAISQAIEQEAKDPDGKLLDFSLPPEELARHMIAAYLSDDHFQNVDGTCPLIAFPSDTARGGKPVKQAYQKVLSAMVSMFEASQSDRDDARQRAITMATLCVGGMVLARAVDDPKFSGEIRAASLEVALGTGGWDIKPPLAAE